MPALRSSSGICSRNRFGVSDRRAMLSLVSPGGRAGRLCPPEPASLERIFHLPRDHGSPWGGKTPRPKDRHRPAGRRDPVHCPDRRPGGAVAGSLLETPPETGIVRRPDRPRRLGRSGQAWPDHLRGDRGDEPRPGLARRLSKQRCGGSPQSWKPIAWRGKWIACDTFPCPTWRYATMPIGP